MPLLIQREGEWRCFKLLLRLRSTHDDPDFVLPCRLVPENSILGQMAVDIHLGDAFAYALRVLDTGRADFFSQCGYLYLRAELLCKMGRFAEAIETLRNAPFGAEIDVFPALTYEAIFLYCYLLKKSGREPPPNLVAALPEDFVTRTWDGRKVGRPDLSPPAGASTPST